MSKILLTEMEDQCLEFSDSEGVITKFPIVGAFTIGKRYYVVVHEGETDQVVVLKVIPSDEGDYVQVITESKEWQEVINTWEIIVAKAEAEQFTQIEDLKFDARRSRGVIDGY